MLEKIIRYAKMPLTIKAVTVLDENGDYNIYVNEDLSKEATDEAIEHELKHINLDDFFRDEKVRDIEKRCIS